MMEFLESQYLYLGLMLFTISYPLAQSFEYRVTLYKQWKAIFAGTVVMMICFIPWDIWFTDIGVWWFRDDYITGLKIFLLPIEEWLFFIVVPYACLFIYEVLKYYIKHDLLRPIARYVFIILSLLLGFLAWYYYPQYYTFITFGLTSIACLLLGLRNPDWIGRFLMMYVVSWIPFVLVNGALTGMLTKQPIVNYNEAEIIGLRIITIPVEDSVYSLLMLMLVVTVYEYVKSKPNNSST